MTPDQRRRRQGRPDNQGSPLAISPVNPTVDLNPEIATGLLKFHSITSLDGVTIDLGGKVYTFDSSLLNIQGHVHIETDVPTTLSNLLAAMSLGPGVGTKYAAVMTAHPNMDAALGALIAATGVLTLSSNAAAGNTVTIDGKVYTFRDAIEAVAAGVLTLSSNAVDGNTVTIDGKVYTFKAILGTAATNILTFGANPLNAETVTIGGKLYKFETTLTNVDGNVLRGANASDSLDNLIAAIELGAGSGTLYAAATTLNPDVTAVAGTGDTMDVTAKVGGTGGNSITTVTDVTSGSWAAGTLLGGLENGADGDVLIGTAATDSIDNLIAAIVLGAGSGTAYASATTLHSTVTAVAGAGDTMDATAKAAGVGGNVATIATLAGGSWGSGTLLGGDGAADGDVHIGAAATDSLDNLVDAMNLGPGVGVDFAIAMTPHPSVFAAAGAGDTLDATADTPGAVGNAIATIATLAGGSWATPKLTKGADTGDMSAKVAGVAGNALVQTTGNNNLIDFDDTVLSGGADAGGSLQMNQIRTLFAKDVSERGGFPTWKSADENLFTVSQPDDPDGDGVVEDKGGVISGVGTGDGAADVTVEFPGVPFVAAHKTLVTLT